MERMGPRGPIGLIALVWVVCTALWLTPGITRPDGAGYYVYLPSSWFDRDLLFFDEWYSFGLIRDERILFKEVTPTDHLGNHWPAGSAVYWLPSFAVGDLLSRVFPAWSPPRSEGIALPFIASCVVSSAIAGLLTMIAGFVVARRWFAPGVSAAAAIAVWLGSPMMWYALRNSLMSHATGALATALIVLLSLRLREKEFDRWDVAALGLACGFAFAIRPQNAVFALVPFIILPNDPMKRLIRKAGWLALGALIAALPQFVVSQVLYGSPLGFMKLGGGPSKPFAPFERIWIWEPLLSWFHGMIPWTPFLAISIAGFVFLWRVDRRIAAAAVYAFATQWLINSVLERSFWGGYAFGQRRFDNCTIFFILGAAAFFAHARRSISWLASTIAIAWTMLLFFAGFRVLNLNRYQTPSELFAAAGEVLGSIGEALVPLGAVPPDFRSKVVVIFLAVSAVTAAILFGIARLDLRARVMLAAVYFVVVSAFFAVCGANAAQNREKYARVVAFNKSLGVLSGAVDFRIGLLRDEALFLRKSARHARAVETERELAALLRAREVEARKRGIEFRE